MFSFSANGQSGLSENMNAPYEGEYKLLKSNEWFNHVQNDTLADRFLNDSLLNFYYPGKLFFDSSLVSMGSFVSSAGISVWKWADCKASHIVTSMDDSLIYIDTLVYDSRLLMRKSFTDKNKNKFLVAAFNTTPYQSDFFLTGRFTPGFLSIALMKLNSDGGQNIFFDQFVGAFGQFCMAPSPQLIELIPNQFVITFKDFDGGPGGPFIATQYFYNVDSVGVTLMFSLPESDFQFSDHSYWNTRIMPVLAGNNNEIFSVVTEGELLRKDFEASDYIDKSVLPENLQQLMAKKSNVKFTIHRSFKIVNRKFVLVSSTLKHN